MTIESFLRLSIAGLAGLALTSCVSFAEDEPPGTSSEAAAAYFMESVKDNEMKLRLFLEDFPKGGDLHNHSSGTPYAEEYLSWASDRGYCIDTGQLAITEPPCGPSNSHVSAIDLEQTDPALYQDMIDALSVRKWLRGVQNGESGHQQFFGTFLRFDAVARIDRAKVVASALRKAAFDNVSYLELMHNPLIANSFALQRQDPEWVDYDFEAAFHRLEPELDGHVKAAIAEDKKVRSEVSHILGCETDTPEPACDVTYYFNGFGLRLFPNANVFTQLAIVYATIDASPSFLGVSLVQPEDDPRAVGGYHQHMEMIRFLKTKYPSVRVSLHAGEVALGLVPPSAMQSPVRDAILVAGSERIGHGVGIAFEKDGQDTLNHMARENIAVEINLSSNDVILGVRGKNHPLNLYRSHGVPFVLSTDDQGVLRSDMTDQFQRAVGEHGLTYSDLKIAARNSLEFAFLPGDSLWINDRYSRFRPECTQTTSETCKSFLEQSPKAKLQWQLEKDFETFERTYTTQ